MADIIEQMTPEQLRSTLRGLMSAFTLARTGDTWDATDADGADLVLESMAKYVSDLRQEFNGAAADLLPGPDSPYLAQQVSLVGVSAEPGESNDSLWRRRAVALTQPSLGSPVALRELLVLSLEGVVDASFITQPDGSQNIYLVSATGDFGIPSMEQNAAALALVNSGRARHVGRPFQVLPPTARRYSIVLTVYYSPETTPDLAALRSRVAEALETFVVASRKLGREIAQSNLYDAAKVEGVRYTEGGFYQDALEPGSPRELEKLIPADESVFYTCKAAVNHVESVAEGTDDEINLIWQVLS